MTKTMLQVGNGRFGGGDVLIIKRQLVQGTIGIIAHENIDVKPDCARNSAKGVLKPSPDARPSLKLPILPVQRASGRLSRPLSCSHIVLHESF